MHIRSLYHFARLTRLPVSLAVTYAAFTAMVVYTGTISREMFASLAGIFLLACGASAFNQYQEYSFDEKMERTRRRPVPSRQITPSDAVRISSLLFMAGGVILLYWSEWVTFGLGLFNIIWYNGVYTWLKRRTAFAVVPGAITGAIPVMMGWTSMGGHPFDLPVLLLSFFLFLWQMPHFWLMMLKYGEQYKKAGFPVLTDHLRDFQMKTVTVVWLMAAGIAAFFLILFGVVRHAATGYAIITGIFLLITLIIYQLFISKEIRFRLIFIAANMIMILVLTTLIADKLL